MQSAVKVNSFRYVHALSERHVHMKTVSIEWSDFSCFISLETVKYKHVYVSKYPSLQVYL